MPYITDVLSDANRVLRNRVLRKRGKQQAKVIEAKLLYRLALGASARPKQNGGPVPMSNPWRPGGPLNDSMNGLSVGFAGREKSSVTWLS